MKSSAPMIGFFPTPTLPTAGVRHTAPRPQVAMIQSSRHRRQYLFQAARKEIERIRLAALKAAEAATDHAAKLAAEQAARKVAEATERAMARQYYASTATAVLDRAMTSRTANEPAPTVTAPNPPPPSPVARTSNTSSAAALPSTTTIASMAHAAVGSPGLQSAPSPPSASTVVEKQADVKSASSSVTAAPSSSTAKEPVSSPKTSVHSSPPVTSHTGASENASQPKSVVSASSISESSPSSSSRSSSTTASAENTSESLPATPQETSAKAPTRAAPNSKNVSSKKSVGFQPSAAAIGASILDAIVEGVDLPGEPSPDGLIGSLKSSGEQKGHPSELLELVESGKIKKLTVTKLRRLLSSNNLKTTGRKAELIARLTSFAKST